MKPFDTTPTSTPGTRYDAPEAFTWKKMKALGLWSIALIVVTAGMWGWSETGVTAIALVSIVIGVACFVAGMFLWTFTGRLVDKELPRSQQTKPAKGSDRQRVIYTHNEVKPKPGGGYTVEQSKHETRFSFDVAEVARGVAWMLKAGKFDRRAVTQQMGWSGEKFTTIMRELETFGMATNHGTGRGWKLSEKAYDWAQSLSAEIDDLADELDRL